MAKVAISVSMDAEFAASLKSEAEQNGEKFSPLVCRYIEAGRNLGRPLLDRRASPNTDHKPGSSEHEHNPPQDPKAAVYSCITGDPQTLDELAAKTGLPVSDVGDIVDKLANSGEPVMLKIIDGSWCCWEDRNE